jgi:hypothetical protein
MRKITPAITLAAGLFCGLATVAAQTPKPNTEFSGAPKGGSEKISIVGCLMDERDVPGQKVSSRERSGVAEDYLILNAAMAPGSTVQGLALKPIYEIEGLDEAAMKPHRGHQVELEGKIHPLFSDNHEADDMPDFYATKIKMLAATCPAK